MTNLNAATTKNETTTITMASADPLTNTVMSVLNEVRPVQSNGQPYGETSNLTDAGFTSMEMVNVMLGIEAAFDMMIPQEFITPENFTSGASIAKMVAKITQARAN